MARRLVVNRTASHHIIIPTHPFPFTFLILSCKSSNRGHSFSQSNGGRLTFNLCPHQSRGEASIRITSPWRLRVDQQRHNSCCGRFRHGRVYRLWHSGCKATEEIFKWWRSGTRFIFISSQGELCNFIVRSSAAALAQPPCCR